MHPLMWAALALLVISAGLLCSAGLAATRTPPSRPGRHRAGTVIEVGANYMIARPALHDRYAPFVARHGHGIAQAREFADRCRRRQAVETRRAARRRLDGYAWLATWTPTGEYPVVAA